MENSNPVYLDYNATTPIIKEVADAMQPYLYGFFGNPSSTHPFGIKTKLAVENARQQVASLINCQAHEVIFTSGGTESNNYAIRGAALSGKKKGNHIITSAIEHPAVLEVCHYLEGLGFEVTYLPVDRFGMVNPQDLEKALTPHTILVSIMHANNEVGTVQPISELVERTHAFGALFHTDAAQSAGKLPIDVVAMGVDLLSIAGHKLYAPKGVGALYVRTGVRLEKLMYGADHEANRRPGTENVLEIVGLGKACEIAARDLESNTGHFTDMRDRLHQGLQKTLPEGSFLLNGHPENRLPNTLSLAFYRVEANNLLSEINDHVAASAGAACHSDEIDLSHVLEAMQVPMDYAMGTIRFTVGRGTTAQEIDKAVKIISASTRKLLPQSEGSAFVVEEDISQIKLTRFTQGLGCACKLRPQALEKVLANLPIPVDPRVLVDASTDDDAAVFQLTDDLAIVQTVDFFTPIVDDPYWFGAISAANSLSDVYAMGATPLFGLNIVGFPSNRLPLKVLERILEGAQAKAAEAGISILGGHTVDDPEPKFGMAVTGVVHPQKVLRNANAQLGDWLILTKPIGLGIISTAMKRGLTDSNTVELAIQIMATLNKYAAEAMLSVEVHACTDITGFGFLGHLRELTKASHVNAEIELASVPILKEARQFAAMNVIPGGSLNNLSFVADHVQFDAEIAEIDRVILADAQTSGGLLISLAEDEARKLLTALSKQQVNGYVVGRITQAGEGKILVRKSPERNR